MQHFQKQTRFFSKIYLLRFFVFDNPLYIYIYIYIYNQFSEPVPAPMRGQGLRRGCGDRRPLELIIGLRGDRGRQERGQRSLHTTGLEPSKNIRGSGLCWFWTNLSAKWCERVEKRKTWWWSQLCRSHPPTPLLRSLVYCKVFIGAFYNTDVLIVVCPVRME